MACRLFRFTRYPLPDEISQLSIKNISQLYDISKSMHNYWCSILSVCSSLPCDISFKYWLVNIIAVGIPRMNPTLFYAALLAGRTQKNSFRSRQSPWLCISIWNVEVCLWSMIQYISLLGSHIPLKDVNKCLWTHWTMRYIPVLCISFFTTIT